MNAIEGEIKMDPVLNNILLTEKKWKIILQKVIDNQPRPNSNRN